MQEIKGRGGRRGREGQKGTPGPRVRGRDADARELFRGAHKASHFVKRLGQRRGSWSEMEANVPRTFDSIPSWSPA